nr:unnamed protein product [Callosobruchus chinensis]
MDRSLDLVLGCHSPETPITVNRELYPLVPEDTYHPALSISVKVVGYSSFFGNVENFQRGYDFKKADFEKLVSIIAHVDWHVVTQQADVDEALKFFYEVLYQILDECVPKFKFQSKYKKYHCWYDKDIRHTSKSEIKIERKT